MSVEVGAIRKEESFSFLIAATEQKKKSFEDEHLNLCTHLHKDEKHTKTVDYAVHSNFPFFKSCMKSFKGDKNREKSPRNSLEK